MWAYTVTMKVQGRDCTLTVAKGNEYYPLPYSEETVRQTSKGYSLPGVIGCRNRVKLIETQKILTGCIKTKLMYQNILFLFLRLFNFNDSFDIFADRKYEKIIYRNARLQRFELEASNGFTFGLTFFLRSEDDFYTEGWNVNTPSFPARDGFDESDDYKPRQFFFDGHKVTFDGKTIPLVTQFYIEGKYTERVNYFLTLCFYLDTKTTPANMKIEKLTIPVDKQKGIWLDLYDLEPLWGQFHTESPDAIRGFWKWSIQGPIVLNIRNNKDYYEVLL